MRKAFGAYTLLVLVVLYAPIAVMIGFSFNESKYLRWTGFTLDWYRRMADNRDLKSALVTTLILAAVATVAATVLGTMAALAARKAFRGKQLYTTLVSLPVMVPDIVLAISMLALFRRADLKPSLLSAIIAHTTFNLSYVALVVSARPRCAPSGRSPCRPSSRESFRAGCWRLLCPSTTS